MATSRDDQSARVTKKDLKDVQCTDTTKKDRQDGISNQPSKTRASTLQLDLVCHRAASSDSVSVSSLHRAKPQRSYRALKLSSDLPSHASKPNAATCFHIVAWSRCFVPRWLGLSAPLPCDIYSVHARVFLGADSSLEPCKRCTVNTGRVWTKSETQRCAGHTRHGRQGEERI